MEDLAGYLRRLLGDTVILKFRAHGHHWNVTGPYFQQLHALFGTIYSDLDDSIDPLAENLRKIGAVAPYTLDAYLADAQVRPSDNPATWDAMCDDLLAGLQDLLACLVGGFDEATEANQQGIANFLAERIDATQKWIWQLTVTLGRPVTPMVGETDDEDEDEDEEDRDDVEQEPSDESGSLGYGDGPLDSFTTPVSTLLQRLDLAARN